MSTQDSSADTKLWGGRFAESTDKLVEQFSESVSYDRRLYKHDIAGSIAHAWMLAKVGVLTRIEASQIEAGLRAIEQQIDEGEFEWKIELEDVHMNIEAALTEAIGEVGKKLHTGRSRNDQIATDLRLYLRDVIDDLLRVSAKLSEALLNLAEREADTVMPGLTHLQVAQPVSFGHHMLAWREMLLRDRERLLDCRKRVNRMPLGSAALAGTVYPIDRTITAKKLGFDAICENSLDAVSDRDFAIEFCSWASLTMVHLSRWSEELIIWNNPQFGYVDLPDRFCTGSSIMPQKKNPDVPELVRGKTGRVVGSLQALLMLMKAQPLAYNRDNQEDKEPLFDAVDTVGACLHLYAEMIPHIKVKRENCRKALRAGFPTATDLADYLVNKGMPFRDAHHAVGSIVAYATKQDKDITALTLDDLKRYAPQVERDVFMRISLEGSLNARNHLGGTAPDQVRAAVARARGKA